MYKPSLIISTCRTNDTQKLWNAACALGWNIEYLNGYRVPEHIKTVNEPVIYVPALLAPIIGKEFNLVLQEPPNDWLSKLSRKYTFRNIQLITMGEARKIVEPSFIKPPNDKSFKAQVYVGKELPKEYPDTDRVLVQDIVNWGNEWRCFILDKKLLTYSIYSRNGNPSYESTCEEDAELEKFVSILLNDIDFPLPNAIVLDVGQINGNWAVIEINTAWGSGIYGCDPIQALQVIRKSMNVNI
jgi:hypothetical protein